MAVGVSGEVKEGVSPYLAEARGNAEDGLAEGVVEDSGVVEDRGREDDKGTVDENGVEEGRVDERGIVEEGRVEEGFVDNGLVEEGLIDNGIVEEGLLDNGILDSGLLDNGVVEEGMVDSGLVDNGMLEDGMVDNGMLEDGIVDNGMLEDGMVDEGFVDDKGIVVNGLLIKGPFDATSLNFLSAAISSSANTSPRSPNFTTSLSLRTSRSHSNNTSLPPISLPSPTIPRTRSNRYDAELPRIFDGSGREPSSFWKLRIRR